MYKSSLFIILAVFSALVTLWGIYIGFIDISFFSLRYRFLSLFSSAEKMDKFNQKSIENAKNNKKEITILIHGADANYYSDEYGTAVWLREQGINVVSFDYDFKASPDVSVEKLNLYINNILKETGTEKINIVGTCLGGMLAGYYAKKFDGAKNINKLVTVLTPLNRLSENDIFYKIDKIFSFNPDPWNKISDYLQGKESVLKTLHIYSTNDLIIPTKYQFRKGDNFIPVDVGHSPLMNVNPKILNLILNFIK
jgi:hypothetical protein